MSNPAAAGLLTYKKHPQKRAPGIPTIEYSTLGWSSSPSAPPPGLAGNTGPLRQRYALRHRRSVASRYGASPHTWCAQEESMKIALSFLLAAALVCTAAPSSYAEPRQVIQGTQVHLTLLSEISSAVARDGDPFVAVVAEPVYLGSQLLLPAGTRVNGIIGAAMGTGGGTLIGAVFSHVARGFGFGLAGSAVYIVARKGKDLELPAQTGILIRMDNTITVPVTSASNASLTSGSR